MERGNPWLRWLDQTAGPLLLWLLARLKFRPTRAPSEPRRIGLIKAAALGDTILLSAIVKDLKSAFPGAAIYLFTGRSNAGLARLLPDVTEAVCLPLKNPFKACREISQYKCDWLIDADSWPRLSALWATASRSGWSIGFETPGQSRHFAFDQKVLHRADVHEIENYRNLIRALGVQAKALPEDFAALRESRKESARWSEYLEFRKNSDPVGLHLWPGGTKSELKEWPLERWRGLILALSEDPDRRFVLTGGPEDRLKNEKLRELLPAPLQSRVWNAAGLSLEESIRLLQGLHALISVNTGVMHLAAAVGTPVLGLHGPTNPNRWGPLGPQHVSVLSPHPQAACLHLGFEYPEGASSLLALELDQVLTGWSALHNPSRPSGGSV